MLAERAELVARLNLEGNFEQRIKGASRALGNLDQRFGAAVRKTAQNLTRLGLVAAAVIGAGVKQGIDSLAELEDATSAVDGAITQMGLSGKVTSAQIATWANEIEASVQAAFDDKEIVAAAASLIRYGKVTGDNLRPALVILTDLAARTGDVGSAADLLAKAMLDPTAASRALKQAGVVLTKQQLDQVKALKAAGKEAEAQKIVLDAMAKSTAGAAAAARGPYRDAQNILRDVTEDGTRALATGFLPVLEKVSKMLATELAKPETLANIKAFGTTLAGSLDSLIAIVQKLPWDTIGTSLKLAGSGAKAILDAFTSMPPWVQTAVLTGWGLNKLTGGALTGIIGELGKGLIKGVLGINAGVVNINAGVVNGGGIPGGGGGNGPGFGWHNLIPFVGGLLAAQAGGEAIRGQVGIPSTVEGTLARLTGGASLPVSVENPEDIARGLADQRRGERNEGRASTATLHDFLNGLIGGSGGAFQRAGAAAGTLDENAGKLVDLFETSTNPSLKSMTDNLAIMKGLAAEGDPATRKALSDDIKALQALIDQRLAELIAATQALKVLTTGNQGYIDYRHGEQTPTVVVTPARPSARDNNRAGATFSRWGPQVAQPA